MNFEKTVKVSTAKEAWDILEKSHADGDKLKKASSNVAKTIQINVGGVKWKVAEYFNRITLLTNQMKSCGESIEDQMVAAKAT